MTCAGSAVIFVSVCAMVLPEPAIAPVTLPAGIVATDHVKVVAGTVPERFILLVPAEQIVCAGGVAMATGTG